MSKKKKTKKDKLIGVSESDKRILSKMAIDVGISLKAYCERILERHVAEHHKVDNTDNRTTPILPKETTFFEPVAIEMDFSSDEPATIHNLKTGEKTKLKKPPPMRVKTGDKKPIGEDFDSITIHKTKSDSIKTSDKKGKFERVEPNIYSNGTLFEHRRMIADKGLTSDFYKTLKEAQNAKLETLKK